MARYRLDLDVDISFYLVLNSIYAEAQNQVPFGPFDTRDQAIAAYRADLVEPYGEEGVCAFSGNTKTFRKTFRKGSPFENCNPLSESELIEPGHFGHGIHEKITVIREINRIPL